MSDGANIESTGNVSDTRGGYSPVALECVECRTVSDATAWRWRSYRIDDPTEDEEPALASYCPVCAEREFGSIRHESGHDGGYYLF